MLAPEILAAFATSQIFHEHPSSKLTSPVSPLSPIEPVPVHKPRPKSVIKEEEKEEAKQEAEEVEDELTPVPTISESLLYPLTLFKSLCSTQRFLFAADGKPKFRISAHSDSTPEDSPVPLRKIIPKIVEQEGSHSELDSVGDNSTPKPINKYLQIEAPYFSFRHASENDLFAMSQPVDPSRFSATPEVPSVSYASLPKSYLETPVISEYRESKSLYEIQTAGIKDEDLSMPRYYTKSRLVGTQVTLSNDAVNQTPKNIEKSRRLKNIRMNLPPLTIGSSSAGGSSNSDKSKDGKKLWNRQALHYYHATQTIHWI